jgi:hypothetical protein
VEYLTKIFNQTMKGNQPLSVSMLPSSRLLEPHYQVPHPVSLLSGSEHRRRLELNLSPGVGIYFLMDLVRKVI